MVILNPDARNKKFADNLETQTTPSTIVKMNLTAPTVVENTSQETENVTGNKERGK